MEPIDDALTSERDNGQHNHVLVVSLGGADGYAMHVTSPRHALAVLESCATREAVGALRGMFTEVDAFNSDGPDQPSQTEDRTAGSAVSQSHDALSQRELQIVRMIGSGRTVGMIAQELGLSVKTVSTYRTRALEKMSMKTNADLIRYVIEHHVPM